MTHQGASYDCVASGGSILRRKLMTTTPMANVENLEKNYEREQAKIAAKREKMMATEDRMRRAFYATEDDKRHAAKEAQQQLAAQAQARAADRAAEQATEHSWSSQQLPVFVDTQRPWSSSLYYASDEIQASRLDHERQVAEANRAAAVRKAAEERQRQEEERLLGGRALREEMGWFNKGALNQEWLAPEQRVRARSRVPLHLAPTNTTAQAWEESKKADGYVASGGGYLQKGMRQLSGRDAGDRMKGLLSSQ